jgi:thioredoxin-related protein
LPSLDKLNRQYDGNELKVLLINIQESEDVVTAFMEENNYSSTVLLDADGEVATKYSVYGIPVAYLIDRQGKVAFRSPGYLDWSSPRMGSMVSSLVGE